METQSRPKPSGKTHNMPTHDQEIVNNNDLKIFSGRANRALAEHICKHLGIALAQDRIEDFPDSETFFKVEEDIRGRDVFIIQPTCEPVNQNMMELFIMLDCIRRASARRPTVDHVRTASRAACRAGPGTPGRISATTTELW